MGDKADAKGLPGDGADGGDLLPQPLGAEVVSAAKAAQAAGLGHGGRQFAAAVVAHRGGHNGMGDVEQLGKGSG